jgi:hypothetical protein
MWIELHGSGHRPTSSCCEHGHGILLFYKCSEILGQLSGYQCRNEDIAKTAQLANRTRPCLILGPILTMDCLDLLSFNET